MKSVRIGHGIVPLNEFKARAGKLLKTLREDGEPFVITRNGKPAEVVVSPEEYDKIQARAQFQLEMRSAEADIEAGDVISTDELKASLKERRAKQSAQKFFGQTALNEDCSESRTTSRATTQGGQ